jgi:serine/threonine-protein kinase
MASPTIGGGRFRVVASLGRGGQAVVLRVFDQRLEAERAVKVLLPHFADNPTIQRRFVNEARAMAALEHPHVVRVYDVNTDEALPYIVMELLPGGSLVDWLKAVGRFPPRQAVGLMAQIGAGIAAAHARGIVHRDLKPGNVLVAADGSVRVTDFGIARVPERGVTFAGAQMGTLGYMAPEQARDATLATPRSDIHALGVTLFVLLTGRDPHDWSDGDGLDEVPPALLPALRAATSQRPEQRHPRVDAFLAALDAGAAELPADAHPVRLGPTDLGSREVDQSDIELVLRPRPTAKAATPTPPKPAAPKAVPYRMPTPDPNARSTPSWSDRTPAQPPRPRGFVVGLDEKERAESQRARANRANATGSDRGDVGAAGDLGVEEIGTFAGQIGAAVVQGVLQLRLVPMLAIVGLFVAGWAIKARWDRQEADQALIDSRAALQAVVAGGPAILDELATRGADATQLRALHTNWELARTPEDRTRAALLLVDAVDLEAERLEVDDPEVDRWRAAAETYRTSLRETQPQ